jgi:hypothetical protein
VSIWAKQTAMLPKKVQQRTFQSARTTTINSQMTFAAKVEVIY